MDEKPSSPLWALNLMLVVFWWCFPQLGQAAAKTPDGSRLTLTPTAMKRRNMKC